MSIPLNAIITRFCHKWGPKEEIAYHHFVDELREVAEAYCIASMIHESLPDTEHKHGDAITVDGEDVHLNFTQRKKTTT